MLKPRKLQPEEYTAANPHGTSIICTYQGYLG